MIAILLLDCSTSLQAKLIAQGFNVESGTAGYCTGVRKLPSQVYEKDVFIYNPDGCNSASAGLLKIGDDFKDLTPEYSLRYLQECIEAGAIFLAFVNRLEDSVDKQNKMYSWIPYMPPMQFTSDKVVLSTTFMGYPKTELQYLAPLTTTDNLAYPVMQSLNPPERTSQYKFDVCELFWNGLGHCLGVIIFRGRGALIALPKFQSNEDVIDTFVHRVMPRFFSGPARGKLTDLYRSADETATQAALDRLDEFEKKVREDQQIARAAIASATREKVNTIETDPTAKQMQIYFDNALRDSKTALFYLYKIIETVEYKFGSEAAAIAAVGERAAWKSVTRMANESYRDARHARKPTDVVKEWTNEELNECFENTKKVIVAYFSTLFPVTSAGTGGIEPELTEGKI